MTYRYVEIKFLSSVISLWKLVSYVNHISFIAIQSIKPIYKHLVYQTLSEISATNKHLNPSSVDQS